MNKPVDILVKHQASTHQLLVTWRPDLGITISPSSLSGARWVYHNDRAWTIPVLSGHLLLEFFHKNYPDYRVSFDTGAAKVIQDQLARESATTKLATAEDGDVPDVLSVTLRPFQRAALAYSLRGKARKIIALDTGLGKTAVASAYARIRMSRTLWITKPSLSNNLATEIKKLTGQNVVRLHGTSPSKFQIPLLQDKSNQHFIITYDSLARSLMHDKDGHGNIVSSHSLWVSLLSAIEFDLLVVDEAHNAKNQETSRWRSLKMLHDKIPSLLFLTATPLVNNGSDLFSLLNLLDPQVFGSKAEFTRAYLSYDGRRILHPSRLQQDLLPYMFRRKKTDVLKDLPPKIKEQHDVTLEGEWLERYNDVLRGLYRDLKNNEYEVSNMFLAQLNRFRQVVSQAKVEHTAEHARTLEENGEKTLIFTQWRETADALGKEMFCDVIHGGVDQDERTRMQDKFNNDPLVRHLVLTLDTGREGLNLTAASAIVFNDFGWNPMIHNQAEGRAWGRLNDLHGCLVYYVAVENSVDSFMMQTLQRKQEMIEAGVDGQRVYATQQMSLQKDFMQYLREHRA